MRGLAWQNWQLEPNGTTCAEAFVAELKACTGRYPKLTKLIGEWVEERARKLADRDDIEAEIERRATERARWLFEREIGKPPEPACAPQPFTEEETHSNPPAALRNGRAIPPPPGLEAGYAHRRHGVRRLGSSY